MGVRGVQMGGYFDRKKGVFLGSVQPDPQAKGLAKTGKCAVHVQRLLIRTITWRDRSGQMANRDSFGGCKNGHFGQLSLVLRWILALFAKISSKPLKTL